MASPAAGRHAGGMGADGAAQEFQLETRHLALLVLLVVILCVASFMFGRWVERQRIGPQVSSRTGAGEEAGIEEVDISKDLTFFDTLRTDQVQTLPPGSTPPAPQPQQPAQRQAATSAPRAAQQPTGAASVPSPKTAAAARPASGGRRSVSEGVMIQVFAGSDRAAADAIRKKLRAKGYTALLISSGGTHKVRVGPYADRDEAQRAANLLRDQEHLTTWIP